MFLLSFIAMYNDNIRASVHFNIQILIMLKKKIFECD